MGFPKRFRYFDLHRYRYPFTKQSIINRTKSLIDSWYGRGRCRCVFLYCAHPTRRSKPIYTVAWCQHTNFLLPGTWYLLLFEDSRTSHLTVTTCLPPTFSLCFAGHRQSSLLVHISSELVHTPIAISNISCQMVLAKFATSGGLIRFQARLRHYFRHWPEMGSHVSGRFV